METALYMTAGYLAMDGCVRWGAYGPRQQRCFAGDKAGQSWVDAYGTLGGNSSFVITCVISKAHGRTYSAGWSR